MPIHCDKTLLVKRTLEFWSSGKVSFCVYDYKINLILDISYSLDVDYSRMLQLFA